MKLRDFFYLQKNDRQALLTLLAIIIVCITLVLTFGFLDKGKDDVAPIISTNAPTHKHATKEHPMYYKEEGDMVPHELFTFDPNTADSADFVRLGLAPWQARSIMRYRAKGGIFGKPSDFARVYGLSKKTYETLLPFIHIADDYKPAADFYGQDNYTYRKSHTNEAYSYEKDSKGNDMGKETNLEKDGKVYSYPHKLKAGQKIAINTADTTELTKIPGIGSYYAKAIVRYREHLGGFANIQQLEEIENFPTSALVYIHIDTEHIRKLNINQLSLSQLRKHPYLNYYQAKAICDYRRMRGPLKSLEELRLLKDFPPAEIERLQPYVTF